MNENGPAEKVKRQVHRSPSYPNLSLEEALQKIQAVYNEDRRAWTSRGVILKHLGFTDEKSGTANRTLSALRQYKLLEEKDGQFKVSDIAYSIVALSDSSKDKPLAIGAAALSPKIFMDLWSKYGPELPSDDTMRDYLVSKREFNPSSVLEVVSNFKKTVAFAKLPTSAKMEKREEPTVEIGSYVQWNSLGVDQFSEPKRVRALSDDKKWAFVDGSETGLSIRELTVVDHGAPSIYESVSPPKLPIPAESIPAGLKTRTFSWPLSKEVTAEVKFTGASLNTNHIELLRNYLELAKQALGEDSN